MKVSIVPSFLLCLPQPWALPTRGRACAARRGCAVLEVADSALANDIYRMTLDPRGRVVVAGRGYIRTLIDDDGDGRADRAVGRSSLSMARVTAPWVCSGRATRSTSPATAACGATVTATVMAGPMGHP